MDASHIWYWSSKKNLSEFQADRLADTVSDLTSSAKKALAELTQLVAHLEGDPTKELDERSEVALGAVMELTRYAGYSNTLQAKVAETYALAGKITGIVEATR